MVSLELISSINMTRIKFKLWNLSKDKDRYIIQKVINGNNILSNIMQLYHQGKTIEPLQSLSHMICINILLKLIGKMDDNIPKYIERLLINHKNSN